MDKSELIVVSGVNIVDGGALVVFKDAITSIIKNFDNYKICILVNNRTVLDKIDLNGVMIIEYPHIKRRWLSRLYFEYVHSYFLSLRLNAKAWISMHDISPNTKCELKFVYCHNPSPFYSSGVFDLLYEPKIVFFSLFYKFLYKINIKKNDTVFVQQNWIKREFEEQYKMSNVVVARPDSIFPIMPAHIVLPVSFTDFLYSRRGRFIFYPAYPRVFKNIELILEVAKLSEGKGLNFIVTIDGTENKYSRFLKSKYSGLTNVLWLGLQSHETIMSIYTKCDLLFFPSKLETWGLPLTEAMYFNIPISCSDLPYAHETTAGYSKVSFFDPTSSRAALSSIVSMLSSVRSETDSEFSSSTITGELLSGWDDFSKYILSRLGG